MTNRTLIYLTALVILAMTLLISLNMSSILTGESKNQTYLRYNDVRGMAIAHNQLLYTLNFKQQNTVIDILNKAIHIIDIRPGQRQPPNIEKIVIYRFNNQPDLVINPIAYVNQNLVFSIPEWEQEGYFMELSNGALKQLLSQTYDP
jgi:hypothetical protein